MNAASPITEAVASIREEADFNRSWTDGRRGQHTDAGYIARRIELAEQRDRWADAIAAQTTALRHAHALITRLRAEDHACFTQDGDPATMEPDEAKLIADYDAVLREIEGVLNADAR
jgi:hypothetical protein